MESSNKYFKQGKGEYEQKNYVKAVKLFSKAIEEEPNNPYIYYERGISYFHLKELESSLADMDKAQQLQPKNPYRYSSRAYIKDALGNTRGAIEDYQKAVELDPKDAIAYNNLGLLEEKMGKIEAAKKRFNKADELAEKQNLLSLNGNGSELKPDVRSVKKEEAEEKPKKLSQLKVILNVFVKKETFKEYIQFIKNGFRNK